MSPLLATAVAVFVVTYLLISYQNLPGVHIHRPAAALLGAAAMVVFGVLRLDQAYRLVDLDTLVFILGMMIVIGYLEVSGFFLQVEGLILTRAKSPRQLLWLLVWSSGLLSALFMNDTICLMLTPLVLRVVKKAKLPPAPYLIALATASNIGSVMTPIGNPQNMIIAVHSGIPFTSFVAALLPVSLAGLWLDYTVICRLYRKELPAGATLALEPAAPLPRSRMLYVCLASTGLLLALFIANVHPPLAALGVAALLILAGARRPREAFRHIDWELLLMFAGLFVVMGGLRESGALETVFSRLAGLGASGDAARMAAVSVSSALVSNVVSNVPCVVFFSQLMPGLKAGPDLWLVLAMASTLAGNLTLIGSVANLIVFESAKKEAHVGFREYCRAGTLPAAFLIAAGTLWLLWAL
ncbi:MAG: anion transporter [Candidatus Methylomirabilota bacterium]